MFKKINILILVVFMIMNVSLMADAMKKEKFNIIEDNVENAPKDQIKVYLNNLSSERESFMKKWVSLLVDCLNKNKERISDFDLDRFAFLYLTEKYKIFLDDDGNLDEKDVLLDMAKFNVDFLKPELSNSEKNVIKKAFVLYKKEIQNSLKSLADSYKNYKEKLYRKIDIFNKKLFLCGSLDNFFDIWRIEALKDRIHEYLLMLNSESSRFQHLWDEFLKKYKNKKELSNNDLDIFCRIYFDFASKIFLDENNDVNEEEFLKELDREDNDSFGYELNEEDKKNLIKAFVLYSDIIKKKLELFYKQHKDYKEKLDEKLNV